MRKVCEPVFTIAIEFMVAVNNNSRTPNRLLVRLDLQRAVKLGCLVGATDPYIRELQRELRGKAGTALGRPEFSDHLVNGCR